MDYRRIVPVGRQVRVEAGIDDIVDRKIMVSGRILDDDHVLAEANALFVKLKPGQP